MNFQKKKYTILDAIQIPLRITPILTITLILYYFIASLLPAATVGVTTKFVDTSLTILKNNLPLKEIAIPLILLLAVMAYQMVSRACINFVMVRFKIHLQSSLRESFLLKRANLTFDHIENTDDWDLIKRVSDKPENKINDAFLNLLGLCNLFLVIISIISIIMAQVFWAAIAMIIAAIPIIVIALDGGKKVYLAQQEVTAKKRKAQYFFGILTDREHVLERSMFGYSPSLEKNYWNNFKEALQVELKARKKMVIRSRINGLAGLVVSLVVMLSLVQPVVSGTITVGMFISLIGATTSIVEMLNWDLAYYLQALSGDIQYFKELTQFASLSEQSGGTDLPSNPLYPQKIEFKDVTFRYPGAQSDTLNHLSFVMEADKNYSFVGTNGAGKTTITKLLTGLYTNYSGEILLDGVELRTIPLARLKATFSEVFQDFSKYQLTFRENILLGNPNSFSNKNQTSEDTTKQLNAVLDMVDLKDVMERLPNGMDSHLGKLYENGVDLSGGQWQRIAMARTVFSPSNIKILDEPTAALDPIAESKLYEKFKDISDGYTSIFISHRLASTQLADVIFVLEQGKIVEQGSHNELMDLKGCYFNMYESQRSWYQ